MKETILSAATTALVQQGLNGWTVDDVARRAKCAKGLINYHYRSKNQLLQLVARSLTEERWKGRLAAATTGPGARALDRLWAAVEAEVRSGRFAAWLSLAASPVFRDATTAPAGAPADLARALTRALAIDRDLEPHSLLIEAFLDGLGLRLMHGAKGAEEAYHRFWLTVLEM